ncbi:MAG: AAA family ATPase [Spirochaetales bacterium]|nr:AAA family ATPase [Spirochaetales bacterium]
MKAFFRHISWLLRGVKVFSLVGRSGTGKSFRAKLVAQKYGIELIIDDGLLIRDNKIIAGKSAKREKAFLGAIKTALFDERKHRHEVRKQLEDEQFKRLLIIGTSERMVRKISDRLRLPPPSKVINIEEIASTDEIETAIRTRRLEGKHVIPVPTIEISRKHPHIVIDSIRVFLKRNIPWPKKHKIYEKAVVRPEFGRRGRVTISEAALTQMVLHCADEYDSSVSIKRVTFRQELSGYRLGIDVHVPFGVQLSGDMHGFRDYVIDNLERYTGILIERVDINIDKVSL